MPILYEPAQPVSAAVSLGAGGGAAAVRAQTNPLLVAQQNNMLGLYGQGAALAARAVEGAAERSQNASQFRLAQELQARERGNDRDLEASMFQAQQEARLAQQRQAADLQGWLMNQEMSQKEVMRLQQQKSAIGEVVANPDLSPAEKREFITKLRSGIDVGEARMKQQEAKRMQAQEQLIVEQTKKAALLEQETRKLNAKSAQDRVEVVQDPIIKKQVEVEFDQTFPEWRQQMAAAAANLDQTAVAALQAQRRAVVSAEVEARDGVHSFYEESPGKKIPLKKGVLDGEGKGEATGGGAGGKGVKTVMPATDYAKIYNQVTAEIEKNEDIPAEKKGELRDQRMKEIETKYAEYAKANAPAAETRKPFGGRGPARPAESPVATPAQPVPDKATPAAVKQFQTDLADQTKGRIAELDQPADVKQAATFGVDRARELFEKAGGDVTKLSAEEQHEYTILKSFVRGVLSGSIKPPQPPGPVGSDRPAVAGGLNLVPPAVRSRPAAGDYYIQE